MISTLPALLPYIVPELSGCPQPLIEQALRVASRDFFARTEVWQKELDAMDVVADQAEYPLDPAEISDTTAVEPEVRRIAWVKISGVAVTEDQYDLVRYTGAAPVSPSDWATEFSLLFDDDHIPQDAVTDGLTVKVVLVPNWGSVYVNDFLLTRWGDTIAASVKAALMSQPGRSWTNSARAAYWQDQVFLGMAAADKERFTGRKQGSTQIVIPRRWV